MKILFILSNVTFSIHIELFGVLTYLCFTDMSIFTGIIFLDVFGIIVALIFVLYSYILWIYQTWKRKNVPYFKPIFLFGNKQPSKEGVSLGEDVFKIVEKAQKKGTLS